MVKLILRKKIIPGKPFKRLREEKFIRDYFVTMDIETIRKGNELIPYLIFSYNI